MLKEKSLKLKRYIYLSLALGVAMVIFRFSHQSAGESSHNSESFILTVLNALPWTKAMSDVAKMAIVEAVHTLVRKTAHFCVYALLGVFVSEYILTYTDKWKKALVISVGICMLYACADEIHQLFIPGRSGEVRDVLIDTAGALTGICFMYVVKKFVGKFRKGTNK